MNHWNLAFLDPAQPAHYLAVLGLLSLAGEATTAEFPDGSSPRITTDQDETDLVTAVVAGIEDLTLTRLGDLPAAMQTTTPTWTTLTPYAERSWDDSFADRLCRTVDIGALKNGSTFGPDAQSPAAALTLISGKSHLAKSAGDLWATRTHEETRDWYRADLTALLQGAPPRTVESTMALRFTAADPAPRLRSGRETTRTVPLLEGLALAGQTTLLPAQTDVAGSRGLTWTLNPVPLGLPAIIDLHETRTAPPLWPRYTATISGVGGKSSARRFGPSTRVETP